MRFRGGIVSSFASRGWPGNTLDVEHDQLTFRRVLLDPVVVRREEVDAVEFRRMRLPFLWATYTVIRLASGYVPVMFVGFRTSKLRRSLEALGWRVEDGPRVTWRQVLSSPRP